MKLEQKCTFNGGVIRTNYTHVRGASASPTDPYPAVIFMRVMHEGLKRLKIGRIVKKRFLLISLFRTDQLQKNYWSDLVQNCSFDRLAFLTSKDYGPET